MNKIKKNKYKEKIYSIACIFLIIDQIIKLLVRVKMNLLDSISIIPSFFSLYYVENEGAAFSILQNKTILLIVIGILCLYMIAKYIEKEQQYTKITLISLGIIIGGMIGNLIDRLLYQKVTDYLSFTIFDYNFPVFNLADIGITVGVVLFVLDNIIQEIKERKIKF